MSMLEIKKRNGTLVPFDPAKITAAMTKAFIAAEEPVPTDALAEMTKEVVRGLEARFSEQAPSVEHVQDFVELALMQGGHLEVAKRYIVYRYEHTKIREEKQQEFLETIEEQGFLVKTKSGREEPFSEETVRQALAGFVAGYEAEVDAEAILAQLKYDLYEGITTEQIAKSLILVARSMIERDPGYSKVAARMLRARLYEDVFGRGYDAARIAEEEARIFARNIEEGVRRGLLDERMRSFDLAALAAALKPENDELFEYMGLEILASRYMLEDPETKKPLETPQMFWMRIAMGLSLNEPDASRQTTALEFYSVLSDFYYTPGGRTLFQAGAPKAQLSNCFLNVVPDSLDGIFKSFADNAQYLKWSGGTGTAWSRVRATGSPVKGTGVGSQGIVPFLKIANDVNVAINRSGKRRGAGCVYLETWHLDIEDFLELRKNTGDERRRTHDLNTANWIPDLFMKRVRENAEWTLFSPADTPDLPELYGKAFDERYAAYEALAERGELALYKKVPAADLWKKMLAMLFETGHPWITWKDPSNIRSPQDHAGIIHNSNLCTEITLNTSDDETAVCTIGSLNFAKFVRDGRFDAALVGRVVKVAMRMLDNVIDLNYYPTEDARRGNMRHRPVGLGIRGYHDALYRLGIHFDSPEALDFADESMEVVAYHAIIASSELAKEKGVYESYPGSKWERGIFPQDTIALLEAERGEAVDLPAGGKLDWAPVRAHVKQHGMRNSNTMAIAPTASTANLVGCIPCVEPIYNNLYVKSNKEGDFVVVNKYLVEDLKQRGLWSAELLGQLKFHNGSIQEIREIPAELKRTYKEVFEIDGRWLIEAAARRGRWMDQSQSLNIFYAGASGRELSELYFLAWQKGLKTTYYLRTLGASQVEKASVSTAAYGATHTRKASVAAEAAAPRNPALDPAFLAKVAAGETVGICESCEA
ncbi:MAG: ribonucleoside-diphosphate reductase subunit alpha [Patescibacteria group bacterium]|nr:ribonucleoside-diphosphate reductase subunit alpha [Patescibacteria group bacterium]MDE1944513.1 ribonucleoside-diphosphate reductase subunit alpha [Patescibacteria group bacterium]MDE1944866.1 ribonucleoside-diphosphate reductase subunit alpha [Patescibacteria group bacterium]MDE2057312.1 ribonucleoside-diphosphate reductase subunit alpha [Patescibacteria group bacterium]